MDTQSLKQKPRQLITTVVIPVIYNLGLRFYQASKYKEILTVLDFFIVYPSSQLVQGQQQ